MNFDPRTILTSVTSAKVALERLLFNSARISAIERRLYPCLQIFGGGMFVFTLLNQLKPPVHGTVVAVAGLLAILGLIGLILAIRWFEGVPSSAKWCFLFWLTQTVVFSTPFGSFGFFSGAEFKAVLELRHIGFSFYLPRIGWGFVALIDQDGPNPYIGVNLVAAAASGFFLRTWRRQNSAVSKS
jgi:hypothetical protein